MVLGIAGSGGQLQNVAGEGTLMDPLSSEFSRDSPSPSTCPLVVWEVVREVVVEVMLGSGGATGLTAPTSWTSSPLSAEDGEEALSLGGSMAKVWGSSPSHSSRSCCPFCEWGEIFINLLNALLTKLLIHN